MRFLAGCALGTLLASLSGCATYEVDEAKVFAPSSTPSQSRTGASMRINDESRLTAPTAEQQEEAIGFATHLPAEVSHGFINHDGGRIAWTRVESFTSVTTDDVRPLVVYCYGNKGDRIREGVTYAEKLLPWGDVFLFDYPGYGDSSGNATAEEIYDMSLALAAHLQDQATDRPLIIWGHTLGGFVASQLARQIPETDAVVLETSARDMEVVTQEWKPWYMPMMRTEIADGLADYDSARELAFFDGRILVLGARKDSSFPVKLSRGLHKALQKREKDVTYIEFENAKHWNIPEQYGYLQRIRPFIRSVEDTN